MNTSKRMLSPQKLLTGAHTKKPKSDPSDLTNGCLKGLDAAYADNCASHDSTDYGFLLDNADDFDLIANSMLPDIKEPHLDLSVWQRCVVLDVVREPRTYALVLTLRLASESEDVTTDKENSGTCITKCHLQQQWSHTNVKIGDIVSVQACWDESLKAYKMNNDVGLCITNPDTLISCTSVVGSLFCRRKAVLQDRFKGVDSGSKVMVIGSLVHELLQEVLQKALKVREEIEEAAKRLLHSRETIFMLYGSLLTLKEVEVEIEKFVPNIVSFVEQYILDKKPAVISKDTFQDTITEIQDIEENVWVPQLGLKGKIDVSVQIKRRRKHISYQEEALTNAIPLELKTGRASFSMEHKGQVILYQMMLGAIGRETRSSLLLYLRDGVMREINGARNEQRDLMMLRNELGHYLTHMPPMPPINSSWALSEGKFVQPVALPEPISHRSACENCAYATICCSFAKSDTELQLSDGHPLRKVMQEVTTHLASEDYEYFMRWCALLALEEQEVKKSNYLRALWTDPPEIRKKNGRAILDVQIKNEIVCHGSSYIHTFSKTANQSKDESLDLLLSGFAIGEYVIVSTRTRLAVAAGCIYDMTNSTISISLERDLSKKYKEHAFIIDKHESQSGNAFNFTNVSLLLEDTAQAAAMRAIVVQRSQPTFHKCLPKIIATEGASILKQLNAVQRNAVLKALTTENYLLIKGLPGTGKTQTLVALVRLLQVMGKSVLITSHTHSAVDNLLVRLKAFNLQILRLGSDTRINTALLEFSETHLLKDCKTVQDVAVKYSSYNIVGVTCLGTAHSLFLHRKFDYCIIDEATQVMQPTTLRPLFFCEKFILVGDPEQLPPLIRSKEARQRGADESLFHRLDTATATAVLTLQYRMNKIITKLANELTYAGALQCASKQVELNVLDLQLPPSVPKWLQRALHTHIDQSVFLLDTGNCAERSYAFFSNKHSKTLATIEENYAFEDDVGKSPLTVPSPTKRKVDAKRISKYTNYCEAAVILDIVRNLLSAKFEAERIGIIAPYRAQVEMLRKLIAQCQIYSDQTETPALTFTSVEVNTVDQYQGRDKDIILYSCTRSGSLDMIERTRDAEILEDKRRLTVAITRAKHKLLLVGDVMCLKQYTHFNKLLNHIPSYCKLQLEEGKLDFNWEALLQSLSKNI